MCECDAHSKEFSFLHSRCCQLWPRIREDSDVKRGNWYLVHHVDRPIHTAPTTHSNDENGTPNAMSSHRDKNFTIIYWIMKLQLTIRHAPCTISIYDLETQLLNSQAIVVLRCHMSPHVHIVIARAALPSAKLRHPKQKQKPRHARPQ